MHPVRLFILFLKIYFTSNERENTSLVSIRQNLLLFFFG